MTSTAKVVEEKAKAEGVAKDAEEKAKAERVAKAAAMVETVHSHTIPSVKAPSSSLVE